MVINWQSIKNKVIEFWETAESLNSDVILGCESWHTEEIANEKLFPSNLTIYHKDRPDGYFGVILPILTR